MNKFFFLADRKGEKMMRNIWKKITVSVLVALIAAVSGCSNTENNNDEEAAVAAVENYVRDYYTLKDNEDSKLMGMFKEFRAGVAEERDSFLMKDEILAVFGELPAVETVKVEEVTPAVVDLKKEEEYRDGSTAIKFKGELPIYDSNGLPPVNGNTFYGYELLDTAIDPELSNSESALLKDHGEWRYGDILDLDIAEGEKGFYRAYDVVVRWGYENKEMNQAYDEENPYSEEDVCLMINRSVFRVVYVDNVWVVYNEFFPSDGRYCTAVI